MKWTEEQEELLKRKYSHKETEKLMEELGKTRNSITTKASRLNLSKERNHALKKRIEKTETPEYNDEELNWFISGFVAGEGCFTYTEHTNTNNKLKFRFGITLSEKDSEILDKIKKYFDAGNRYDKEAREPEWDRESIYTVQDVPSLVKKIIPFFDEYGFKDTHKQKQYDEWRKRLVSQYDLRL